MIRFLLNIIIVNIKINKDNYKKFVCIFELIIIFYSKKNSSRFNWNFSVLFFFKLNYLI